MARATGSYPVGHGFKSNLRYQPFKYGPLVKRLRHGPFTAVTWVRFPYGSPKYSNPNFSPIGERFGFVVYIDGLE